MSFIRKTAAFTGLRALRNLVSDSMAIDVGSSGTIIWVHGRGVVVDEPSVVAVNALTGEVVAAGIEAQQMYGREARDVKVISPLVGGVVADFVRTREMLTRFVRKARSGVSYFSRRAVMSVPSDVTPVERRALISAAEDARIGRVWMIDEGLAAAYGVDVRAGDRHALAVADVGGGTTNVAVVAKGRLVHARAERIGSSDINDAIVDHVRRHRGLIIGALTAESLKLEMASLAVPSDLARDITVKGRDVQTGGPGAITITVGELYPVAHFVVRKIAEVVRETLTELPPEVAADVYDFGITLTGGGAQFAGLEAYLREHTKLPVRMAEEPRFAIARGLARMFDEPLTLRRLLRDDLNPLLGARGDALDI